MAKRKTKRGRYDKWELQRQFAVIIRNKMKRLGCTQGRLAWMAGISDVHLSNVLNCNARVTLDTMAAIFGALPMTGGLLRIVAT